jgi:hypothetical protein
VVLTATVSAAAGVNITLSLPSFRTVFGIMRVGAAVGAVELLVNFHISSESEILATVVVQVVAVAPMYSFAS